MLKITVDKENAKTEVNGTLVVTCEEMILAIRSVYDSLLCISDVKAAAFKKAIQKVTADEFMWDVDTHVAIDRQDGHPEKTGTKE